MLVRRFATDALQVHSRLVKLVGIEAAGQTSYVFYKTTMSMSYLFDHFSNYYYNAIQDKTLYFISVKITVKYCLSKNQVSAVCSQSETLNLKVMGLNPIEDIILFIM